MTTSQKPALYAPPAYAAADPASIVRRHPFATLVTMSGGRFHATPTPIFFEPEGQTALMIGHMARQNAQAQAFEAGQPALAIFQGPHTYVSASWYVERPSVPTWNYVAAQAHGVLEPIDDPAEQIAVLRRTAEALEGESAAWTLEKAPPGRVDDLLPRIRAFRLRVEALEGVTKLSQMNPPADRLHVIRHLLDRGDAVPVAIARLMAQLQAE